ncbi:MAG: helix-turn-helix domain-containing protein [Planctomycetes bacterium]|nr:helix-turn-helix domain-containing protein [Planctomycetota bacterium]
MIPQRLREPAPPSLVDLLERPALLEDLDLEAIPELLGALEGLKAKLQVRLVELAARARPAEAPDRLLSVAEVAERLAVSEDWLYRSTRKLPFVVRLSPQQLRFSERGLERWIRQRRG